MGQRLIDADALKEYIDCGHLRNPCEVCFSELDVVNLIDAQPTIEAEPVCHGKWTVTPIYIKCSECSESFMLIPQNYCPNCGARMDANEYDTYQDEMSGTEAQAMMEGYENPFY